MNCVDCISFLKNIPVDKRDVETDKVKPVLEKKEIGEGTEDGSNKKQEVT